VDATGNIQYVGLRELDIDPFTEEWVKKLAVTYSQKLTYALHNPFNVVLHIKEYRKEPEKGSRETHTTREGKRHKYSVTINVSYPGKILSSSSAHDWDLRKAVHKGFRDIEQRLSHIFSVNVKEIPPAKAFF
jgi:hypothetical protein